MVGPPRVCLEVWGGDPRALIATAQRTEQAGVDGVYLGESPTGLNADLWTTLGALAATTTTLRFGPVIANLLPAYRSPVVIARHGATLAALSDGRFDFRTGIGAGGAAARRWWGPAGVDYPTYTERAAAVDRQLTTISSLWTDGHARVGGEPLRLGLDHPPIEITVAGATPTAFGLVDRHADRWETSFCTIDEWTARRIEAGPAGQRATSLEVDGFVAADAAGLDRLLAQVRDDRPGEGVTELCRRALVGTPTELADQLRRAREVGIDQLVVALHDPHEPTAVDVLGEALRLARGS